MITNRSIAPENFSEKVFEGGDFYLLRDRKPFAYVRQTGSSIDFCPCNDAGKPDLAEGVTYSEKNGKKAICEFVKLLTFPIFIKFDLRGS